MFSSLSILLNGKPVTLHETNYHYKAYIEKLLNYGSDASSTHPISSFWYLDSPGEVKEKTGYTKRSNYHSNGKTWGLYGRLHADLFNSDKMLINVVDMNIKLTHAPDAFHLLTPSGDNELRIKILDATLFITQVELKPLFFLLTLIFWEWNAMHIILLHILKFKLLVRVLGLSRSLSTMHFLDQFQNGFS